MADIERIFIRAQEPNGSWVTKSLKDCSLWQFLDWAVPRAREVSSRLGIPNFFLFAVFDHPDELKSDFVDWLRANGEIVYELKTKKEAYDARFR